MWPGHGRCRGELSGTTIPATGTPTPPPIERPSGSSNWSPRALNALPLWWRLAGRRAPPQRYRRPHLGPFRCLLSYVLQSAILPPAPPPRPLLPPACPDALADARRKPQICRAARNNRSIPLNWPAHGSRYSSVSGSRFRFRNPSIAPTEPCLYT